MWNTEYRYGMRFELWLVFGWVMVNDRARSDSAAVFRNFPHSTLHTRYPRPYTRQGHGTNQNKQQTKWWANLPSTSWRCFSVKYYHHLVEWRNNRQLIIHNFTHLPTHNTTTSTLEHILTNDVTSASQACRQVTWRQQTLFAGLSAIHISCKLQRNHYLIIMNSMTK